MTYERIINTLPTVRDYGYTAGGGNANIVVAITEKYDDIANTWTAKANLNTARRYLAGFSLNGYGYTAGGSFSAITEKYDDTANTWTAKANMNIARERLAGFSLNGYGYTAGGWTGGVSTVTEKYDDIANTWTAKANLNTARRSIRGFSLNGYGYTAGGDIGVSSAITEKYDDIANTWTVKANLNTARYSIAEFSLNGYGYTAGGFATATSAITEKYNDVANTWTAKANLNTARQGLAGFSLNGYGYAAGGLAGVAGNYSYSAVTEKYDDIANTWTAKADINTARYELAGFSLPLVVLSQSCPTAPKYSGDTVTLQATPKDGIGPYYVEFQKNSALIDPSRLGGTNPGTSQIYDAPENVQIIRVYTLDDLDISSASGGTINFSVYMEDSCPTGFQTCTDTCTITIGCVAPVCNFVVT